MDLKILEIHTSFGGKQIKYQHTSKILKCEMIFSLFLPESKSETVPLIWW